MSSKPTTERSSGMRRPRLRAATMRPIASRSLAARIAVGRGRRSRNLACHCALLLDAARTFQDPNLTVRSVLAEDVEVAVNAVPAELGTCAFQAFRFDKSSIAISPKPQARYSKSFMTECLEMLRTYPRCRAIIDPDERDVWNQWLIHDDCPQGPVRHNPKRSVVPRDRVND